MQANTKVPLYAFLLIVGVIFAYAGVSYLGSISSAPTGDAQKNVVTARVGTWESKGANSTKEALASYVQEVDGILANGKLSESTKRILLLRKATIMALPRTLSPNPENVLNATAIARSVYEAKTNTDDDIVLKHEAVLAYFSVLRNSCYSPAVATNLPEKYKAIYEQEVKKGKDPNAALLLAYIELGYDGISPKYNDDQTLVNVRSYFVALYLHSFNEKDPARKDILLKRLKIDVARSLSLKKGLNTSVGNDVNVQQTYAFAYDIATTYEGKTIDKSTNAIIDANYERVYALADKLDKDANTRAIWKGVNTLFYLDSIYRRYTEKERDVAKVNRLADLMVENMSTSNETKQVFASFFLAGKSDNGTWMKVRTNFYDIARANPKLKDFLEKQGVSL